MKALELFVLINALYFKANWTSPFSVVPNAIKQKFYKTPTETVDVLYLNKFGGYCNYYECPHLKAKFLEIPFQGNEASMTVVLPHEKDGLSNLENQLESVFVPQHKLENTLVNVDLPKFRIESSINFKEVLLKLGVKKIFDSNEADLSGIAGKKGDLVVSKVVQKTFIDVNEQGVEAAAATLVVTELGGSAALEAPKVFYANHPFIFYIKIKDIVVFAGRVTDPSI